MVWHSLLFWKLSLKCIAGDIFNRDMEFDLGESYHITKFKIDCRLSDTVESVEKAATLMVIKAVKVAKKWLRTKF